MFCLKLKRFKKERLVRSSQQTKYLQLSSSKKFLFRTFAWTEGYIDEKGICEVPVTVAVTTVLPFYIFEKGVSTLGGSNLSEGCCSHKEASRDIGIFSPSKLKKASRSWRVALLSSFTSSICLIIFSVWGEARVHGKLSVFILDRSSL